MSSITISIPDKLENEFRRLTLEKFGDKRGRLSLGAIEALTAWCETEDEMK
jgi:hypothetical protein